MLKSGPPNLGMFLMALILPLLLQFPVSAHTQRTQSAEQAYVTLLYGDEFLLGVRVLGKSIRDTGSTVDMVALVSDDVSDDVSDYAKRLLEADGWIIEMISLLENPNRVRPTRFWGVYIKLKIFNLTNYKKVVYLDADTIVIKNIDNLFKCGKFCANLKHSERLNSGVLVVEPSEELFKDMVSKVQTLYSYTTGGDQGFLNSYYVGFANAQIFNPDLSLDELKPRPLPEMQRLSTLYNADVGLYMLANKWMVDEKELRVIHYTLGPLKPWDWWTAWLVKPVDLWQDIRRELPESLPGTRRGSNPRDELLVKFLFLILALALLFFYYRSSLQCFGSLFRSSSLERIRQLVSKLRFGGPLAYSSVSSSTINHNQQIYYGLLSKVPASLGGTSVVACLLGAVLSLGLAFSIVPRQVVPWTGLLLLYEWTFIIFFLLFGGYLHLVYQLGRRRATQLGVLSSDSESLYHDSGKGHQRQLASCDVATWYYVLGMVFLAIAAPSLPFVLGITALFVRLGLMVAGGIVLTAFMAYSSEHLAIRSFMRGLEDRDIPRTRNWCTLG